MNYLDVCTGIAAASVAWGGLGWTPVGFSEIEAYPSAVLAHRFPAVRNLGDMNRYAEWQIERAGLLVGGTPCQSFSVAGLRAGIADPRGNLALVYLGVAARFAPRWIVWENVSGVLSSGRGRDFGAFVGGLEELGYGVAWRTLDAQFFGVPQRRRRVFVVGYFGDWRPAAAVLFEPESLRGRARKSRAARPDVAGTIMAGAGRRRGSRTGADEAGSGLLIASNAEGASGLPFLTRSNLAKTVNNQTPLIAFNARQDPISGSLSGPVMATRPHSDAIAYDLAQITHPENRSNPQPNDPAPSLAATGQPVVQFSASVRRFTPRECERLQGFPDDWTAIPFEKKATATDNHRYAALGNSMAVPVMRWLGERIELVERSLAA